MFRSRPFLLSALAVCLLASCQLSQGGGGLALGLVGSVTAGAPAPTARPTLLVRYDGNKFVAWAESAAQAAMWWSGSEPRAFAVPPRAIAGGVALVRVNDESFEWEGLPGDALPEQARSLFSLQEIADWQLVFAGPPPPAPDPGV